MTKDMEIVDNCDPGTHYFSKGFKPQMLAPMEEIAEKLHLERWYGCILEHINKSNQTNYLRNLSYYS